MSFGDELAQALFEVLADSATDEQMDTISKLIQDYKTQYRRSYNLLHTKPFSSLMLQCMEEAVSYRDMQDDERRTGGK